MINTLLKILGLEKDITKNCVNDEYQKAKKDKLMNDVSLVLTANKQYRIIVKTSAERPIAPSLTYLYFKSERIAKEAYLSLYKRRLFREKNKIWKEV